MIFLVFYGDNARRTIKNVALVVVGTLVLSFGTAVFIIPFELVSGGVSGLAIVANHAFGGRISQDLLISIFTWGLFFIGAVVLGRNFAAKTLISSLIYPVGVTFFGKFAAADVFGLAKSVYPQLALLLASLFGGVLVGAGCALTFLGGGSTGGVDVIAFILCKYFKRLKSSAAIFLADAVIVSFGIFVINDMVLSLLGILTAFVSAAAVDKIFIGESAALAAQIVSDKHDLINAAVIERLERTTTVVEATGGYSGKRQKVIFVSFGKAEYVKLLELVSEIDSGAFVTVYRVYEVGGEGWRPL